MSPRRALLTERQREVYDVVRRAVEGDGVRPTHEEIADALGVSSIATVSGHLDVLERKGWIEREGRDMRVITFVDDAARDVVGVARELERRDVRIPAALRSRIRILERALSRGPP